MTDSVRVTAYEYTKLRKEFGSLDFEFKDQEPKVINSIDSATGANTEWFSLIEQTVEVDCIPKMARHVVSTRTQKVLSKTTSHLEGAWPSDMKGHDAKQRDGRRKRLREECYTKSVPMITGRALETVQSNNFIDLYERYFDEEDPAVEATEPPSCKTAAVFRDPYPVHREANCLSWHPEGPNKLAVAYSKLGFQQMPSDMALTSYIWDLNSPNEPEMSLNPQSALVSLEYNPRQDQTLVGGSYNGLISLWDLRSGSNPKAVVENSENSHHDPVYDIRWIQSRTGNELSTTSSDGRILWWDYRVLGKGFVDQMLLKEGNTVYGGTSLGYKTEAGATKFLVGTEQGYVLSCDRKAKKDAESTKSMKVYGKPGSKHHGPIYSIERHPFHHKYFLTVGDWTARIWTEDIVTTPIMCTRYEKSYLTGGCWSPTRSGVFFTIHENGTLDAWDIFYKQNDPTFSTKVTDESLRSIRCEKNGNLLALGSNDGTTTVLHLSSGLSRPQGEQNEEKTTIAEVFTRELTREKNLEQRAKEKKNKEKEVKRSKPIPFDPFADEPEPIKKKLEAVESRFFQELKITKESKRGAAMDVLDTAKEGSKVAEAAPAPEPAEEAS